MKSKSLALIAGLALVLAAAPVALATTLTYSPAAPQKEDPEIVIQHKSAVALASIAEDIAAAITNGAGTLLASEAHIGEVGGNAILVSPTVTVSTSPAYTAGDVVGSKLTLTNAARVSGGSAILDSITVLEKGSQAAALDILIFNADPSGGTYTDNGAFTANDTDMGKCIARVHVASTDYVATGGYTSASLGGLGKVLVASGSANLYAVVVTSGTPTYSATSSLAIKFGFKRN
jgi:hypothetical protein